MYIDAEDRWGRMSMGKANPFGFFHLTRNHFLYTLSDFLQEGALGK